MGKKKQPQRKHYSKMKDTPWVSQSRTLADAGGQGLLQNYNKVNVFDQDTLNSLEGRNNATYQRAFNDMAQNYNDTMNSYAARNYNRFGTLNSTPSSYITDEYQKNYQRQLNDAAYNKAINYENLINNELNRRYNTLSMLSNMYDYGQIGHSVDVNNYNVENTNKDIDYANAMANYASTGGKKPWFNVLQSGLAGAGQGFAITGSPWGAAAGGALGAIGGMM